MVQYFWILKFPLTICKLPKNAGTQARAGAKCCRYFGAVPLNLWPAGDHRWHVRGRRRRSAIHQVVFGSGWWFLWATFNPEIGFDCVDLCVDQGWERALRGRDIAFGFWIVGLNMLRARCLKFISMKSRCLKTAPNGAAALFAVERPEAGSMAQNWQVWRLDVESFEDRAEIALTLVARSPNQRETACWNLVELWLASNSSQSLQGQAAAVPKASSRTWSCRFLLFPHLSTFFHIFPHLSAPFHILPHFSRCHPLVFCCTDVCVAWPLWPGLDMRLLGLA